MTIEEVKQLIAGDEHRSLELKKTTGELKDGMQSVCAFLNTEGGWLIFGIAPTSLKIIGQMVTDNTQRELSTNLERWGTGVSRMIELCREQGVPEPEYVTDGHEVKIVFRKKYTKDSDESKNVNVGSTVGSGGSLTVVQLTERQQKIVKLIKGNPLISSQQMSVVLSVVKRTIERDLAELQKKGVLRREGNTNAGKWVLLDAIKESFG